MRTNLGLTAILLSLAVGAHANLVLLDSFNYTNGPLVGAQGSPWNTHSGTPQQTQVTNGAIRLTSANGEDVNAPLSGGLYNTTNNPAVTELYSSFKVTFTALPRAQGSYFAHFKDNSTFNFRGRVFAVTNGVDVVGNFRLGIGSTNNVSTSLGFALWPFDLATETTYTVVTRLSLVDGASKLWIDPASEDDTSISSTANPENILGITTYAFRQADNIGTMLVDDLRVGTFFNDVAGPNSPPSISSIPNQSTATSTPTGPIAFTIGDAETPADSLVLSKTSSNNALIPEGNIVFGGSGANRTVTVTPASGAQGQSTITISVSDGTSEATVSFVLSVGFPSISDMGDQQTPASTATTPIPFTIADPETPLADLQLSAASSNEGLVPLENIVFSGTGANRTVTITPVSDFTGLSTITITVSDGEVSVSDSFVLTVYPAFGVVMTDDFNRPDGPLVGDGIWISHSGNFQEAMISENQLRLSSSLGEDVSATVSEFGFATDSGTILYSSFYVKFTQLPTPGGTYFAHFKDEGNGFRGRLYASTANAAPGSFRLGIANNAASIGSNAEIPINLQIGRSYYVLTRYNIGTGRSTLWIDPASESSLGVTAPDVPSPVSIVYYAFRQNAGMGTLLVDDLRIGGTFESVFAPRPALQIVRSGNDVEISWAASAEGFVLQSTPAVTPDNWTNAPETPSLVNDGKIVRIFGATGIRFFRLERP